MEKLCNKLGFIFGPTKGRYRRRFEVVRNILHKVSEIRIEILNFIFEVIFLGTIFEFGQNVTSVFIKSKFSYSRNQEMQFESGAIQSEKSTRLQWHFFANLKIIYSITYTCAKLDCIIQNQKVQWNYLFLQHT